MKNNAINAAIILALSATGTQAVTFNFGNNTTDGVQGVNYNFTKCNDIGFTAGTDVRFCWTNYNSLQLSSASASNGTKQWLFSDSTGLMTGVANTAATQGISTVIAYYIDLGYNAPSADRNGGAGLDAGGELFGATYGFLAPYVGSEATTISSPHPNDIGLDAAQYTATSATTFEVLFPVIEMQWNGIHFSLGRDNGTGVDAGSTGITFTGTSDGTSFSMWAEHSIANSEDNDAGGIDSTVQWYYNGTIDGFHYVPEVPVPAAAWLFGSGLIALVGAARRKRSI